MNDRELIDLIARMWVSHGGDAIGIEMCWRDIAAAVRSLTEPEETEK